MMEKRGVIQPGLTKPEDDKPEGEKTASLEELEDNTIKRLADRVVAPSFGTDDDPDKFKKMREKYSS